MEIFLQKFADYKFFINKIAANDRNDVFDIIQ